MKNLFLYVHQTFPTQRLALVLKTPEAKVCSILCRRILNTTPCRPKTKSIPTTMTNTRHLQADEILLRIEKSTVKTTMFLNSYFKSISLHYSNGSRLQYHIQYVQSRSCSPVSYFSYSVAGGGE